MELIKNFDDVYAHYVYQLKIKKNMIKKALDASYEMLKLDDFIRVTEFKLPDIMELNTIRQYKADIPVLITKQLIQSFGYSGEYIKQKQSLIKLIKAHKLHYIKLTNKEYEEFITSKDILNNEDWYPTLNNPNGKSTHILMMPRDLKKLMMVVNTPRGKIIRENYLKIEEFLKFYLEYQCEFHNKSYIDAMKKIQLLPQNVDYMRQSRIQILDDELQNRYKVGVVYYICEEDNITVVKIGYTFNLPERRRQLQTAHYKTLIVLKYYFTQFPACEERRLHELYRTNRIRGEWFEM